MELYNFLNANSSTIVTQGLKMNLRWAEVWWERNKQLLGSRQFSEQLSAAIVGLSGHPGCA